MSTLHNWRFEKKGQDALVITEESLAGWFPKIIKIIQPSFLEQSLEKALQTLKKQAEKTK